MDFTWIDEMYRLQDANEKDEALDLLFDMMDNYMLDGKWDTCAAALDHIDLERLGITLIVGLLSITLRAKDKLPNRERTVRWARDRLLLLAPDRIESLLLGLE